MTDQQNKLFRSLTVGNLLTVLLYGEARGEPIESKVAHAWVIKNRVKDKRWPDNYYDVILQRKQFSCFNDDDPNLLVLVDLAKRIMDDDWELNNAALNECWAIAHGQLSGWFIDNTKGANHYNTVKCDPAWDDKMVLTAKYGKTEFFKG